MQGDQDPCAELLACMQDLLSSLSRDELAQRVHDSADPEGFTPLCVAAARGNARSVMLVSHTSAASLLGSTLALALTAFWCAQLLQAGANVQHYTNRPYCSTPLHEACAYNHAGLVTLLLEHGANPFVENGRGGRAARVSLTTHKALSNSQAGCRPDCSGHRHQQWQRAPAAPAGAAVPLHGLPGAQGTAPC